GRNGSARGSPPAARSCPEPVSRNGLLLARGDCLLPSHHHGVEAPGLLLRCHVETSSDPFGPHSPARSGWPRIGRYPRDEPVARFRSTVLRGIPDLHSPLRIFRSFADRSVQSGLPPRNSPGESPDFLSLPACGLFLINRPRITASGSLHFARFGCSMNLLEP